MKQFDRKYNTIKQFKEYEEKYENVEFCKTEQDIKSINKDVKTQRKITLHKVKENNHIRVTTKRPPSKEDGNHKIYFPLQSEIWIAVIKALHIKNDSQWTELAELQKNSRKPKLKEEDIRKKILIHEALFVIISILRSIVYRP